MGIKLMLIDFWQIFRVWVFMSVGHCGRLISSVT